MRMDLLYSSKFFQRKLPEAYERLLLEVLAADHSHFVSAEELDASWHIFTPVLQELEALAPPRAADAGPARHPPRVALLGRLEGSGRSDAPRTDAPRTAVSAAPLGASGIQGHRPLTCHAHAMPYTCMPSREQAERPEPYAYGSRGPAGADLLARKFGYSKFGGGIHPYVSAPSVRHDPPPSLSRVAVPPPRSAAASRPAAASSRSAISRKCLDSSSPTRTQSST